MRLEQRLMQYQRLEEPGIFANGGYSPFIPGLSNESYLEIAPKLKIGLVETENLTFTDFPGSFETFYALQELWENSIIDSLKSKYFVIPKKICPPIIDSEDCIIDGNHRSAAASLHSSKMRAILVENQKDVEQIKKLIDARIFYWPHGDISYEELMQKKEEYSNQLCLGEYLCELETPYEILENEGNNGFDINKQQFLEYCVARVIHQTMPYFLGKTKVMPNHFDCFTWKKIHSLSDNYKLDAKETISKLKTIVRQIPLMKKERTYSSDDVIQDVIEMINKIIE